MLLGVLLLTCGQAMAFGKIGHDAVAAIAEANLTPAARTTIEKYLGGRSIVYYASWLDNVRRTPEYAHTNGLHSAAVDASGKHKMWKKKQYRVYDGINVEMDKVGNGGYRQMTDSAVAVSIKILVHLVGDMHCPSHTFFEGISQNRYFYLDSVKYKFHPFWDSAIFDLVHKWYYADYQYQLDRCPKEEKEAVASGTLVDWIEENAAIIKPLYDILTPERNFNQAESADLIRNMSAIAENQVLKAGYRLAHVLNSVFDPAYPEWKR